MTEEEWVNAIPSLMLHEIGLMHPASMRKLRLLAVAYAKHLEKLPDFADSKHVSHLGDEVIEGKQSLEELWDDRVRGWGYNGNWAIANLVLAHNHHLDQAIRRAIFFSEAELHPIARSLILCTLGNPFRSIVADPAWLTPTVQSIAAAIYEDRAFDRLPILADALEEAGCTNADVLLHCREPSEHVRGCWVVDLVLGKE